MSENKVNNFQHYRQLSAPSTEVYGSAGKKLYLNPDDVRGWWIYKLSGTQAKKIDTVVRVCKANKVDLFMDIGANYGEFSIMVADIVDRVVCFEPNPFVFPYLEKSFEHLENVETFEKAISVESGEDAICNFTFNKHYSGGGSIIDGRPQKWKHKGDGNNLQFQKKDFYTTIPVDAANLVEFLEKQEWQSLFIKLDCEGADWEIVKSLEDYFSKLSVGFGVQKKWHIMFESDSSIHARHEVVWFSEHDESELYKFCKKTNSQPIHTHFSTDDILISN